MENFFAELSGSIPKKIPRAKARPGEFVASSLRCEERQIRDGSGSPVLFLREARGSPG